MKKILLVVALVASVGLLAGCKSNTTTDFDNADSAAFDQATENVNDIGNPPVPPEPVEAQ